MLAQPELVEGSILRLWCFASIGQTTETICRALREAYRHDGSAASSGSPALHGALHGAVHVSVNVSAHTPVPGASPVAHDYHPYVDDIVDGDSA